MDTKGGKQRGCWGGGVMNWVIGIDMYTLMCIKLMTIKNLLYEKINKIKFFLKMTHTHTQKEVTGWELLGSPVVKNPPYNAGDASLIPGRGTKIPHAMGQLCPHTSTTEPTQHN